MEKHSKHETHYKFHPKNFQRNDGKACNELKVFRNETGVLLTLSNL